MLLLVECTSSADVLPEKLSEDRHLRWTQETELVVSVAVVVDVVG